MFLDGKTLDFLRPFATARAHNQEWPMRVRVVHSRESETNNSLALIIPEISAAQQSSVHV